MDKTDEELLEQAQRLHAEAENLLVQEDLLATIQRFGPASIVGSYALNLMVRRDIDIYFQLSDDLDIGTFFAIGAAITQHFRVLKASYSNHFIRNFPGFDHGLFWGIQLSHLGQKWKVDLWGHGAKQFAEHYAQSVQLEAALQAIDPVTILRIKEGLRAGDGYRDGVSGNSIYTAVVTENARSIEQFCDWWNNKAG